MDASTWKNRADASMHTTDTHFHFLDVPPGTSRTFESSRNMLREDVLKALQSRSRASSWRITFADSHRFFLQFDAARAFQGDLAKFFSTGGETPARRVARACPEKKFCVHGTRVCTRRKIWRVKNP